MSDSGEAPPELVKVPVREGEESTEAQAEFEKFDPSVSIVDVETLSPEEREDYFKRFLAENYVSES